MTSKTKAWLVEIAIAAAYVAGFIVPVLIWVP